MRSLMRSPQLLHLVVAVGAERCSTGAGSCPLPCLDLRELGLRMAVGRRWLPARTEERCISVSFDAALHVCRSTREPPATGALSRPSAGTSAHRRRDSVCAPTGRLGGRGLWSGVQRSSKSDDILVLTRLLPVLAVYSVPVQARHDGSVGRLVVGHHFGLFLAPATVSEHPGAHQHRTRAAHGVVILVVRLLAYEFATE